MAPVLRLDGDASGAVRATSEVANAAQNLKQHFQDAAGAAGQLNSEFERTTPAFGNSLNNIMGTLMALAGPGALLAGATAGTKEFVDQLERAAHVAPNANLAILAQLGQQQLGTARGLIGQGTPQDRAAGVAQALEGASAADAAFIRAAAPTGVFGSIPGMELSARAYEAQFGGTLPGIVAQSGAAFAGTGLNAEQGLAQTNALMPLFAEAGIGPQAGQALAGQMAQLFGGDGTSKLQMMLQGGIKSGFFEGMPANAKGDPGGLLDYIKSQGMDAETLRTEFPGRGAFLGAAALVGSRDAVTSRYRGVQSASEADAYGMLGIARGDVGVATDISGRAVSGHEDVGREGRGTMRELVKQAMDDVTYSASQHLDPMTGGALTAINWMAKKAATWSPDWMVERTLQSAVSQGQIHDPELQQSILLELKKHTEHAAATERNTRSTPGPSGVQE